MKTEAQKEHHWLQRLVGNWTAEIEMVMEPGKPPQRSTGTDRVRSLGNLWVLCEGEGQMPDGGGTAQSLMTLGYDPRVQRFVGSFIGSVMAHMWTYDGTLDQAGKKLTLDTEGPGFADQSKLEKYRDVIEFLSDDHRTLTSYHLGENGQWDRFMTAHYRRVGNT
jgi:hypothetical protein